MNEMRYGVPFSHITLALQFIMLVESAFILSMLGWYGQLNGSSAYGVIYIISFFFLWEQELKKFCSAYLLKFLIKFGSRLQLPTKMQFDKWT